MTFRNITLALDRLDTLYHAQIRSFDEEVLPDLETQSADRSAALESLKRLVEKMLPEMGDQQVLENQSEVEALIRHIQILIHRNSTLKSRVMATKEQLQESMSRLNAGKRAITAYGSPQSVRNRPKVLTVRK